jgi:hypothetical protein
MGQGELWRGHDGGCWLRCDAMFSNRPAWSMGRTWLVDGLD